MKHGLILLVALLGSIYLGCRQEDHNEAQPQSSKARTPEDESAIVRTENGTIVKRSGWQLPTMLPENKQYHATTVVIEKRRVTVLNSPFFPKEKLLVRFPKFAEDGEVEYKVRQIIEFTDERKKPYCYQFFAEDDRPELGNTYSGVTTFLSYRDDDGDGVFETLGQSCTVPAWVK